MDAPSPVHHVEIVMPNGGVANQLLMTDEEGPEEKGYHDEGSQRRPKEALESQVPLTEQAIEQSLKLFERWLL